MPITITITDPTPEQIAALFGAATGTPVWAGLTEEVAEAPKPKATRKKAEAPVDPEDAALQAELAADVAEAAPEPAGAKAVVDAGTGKPLVASTEPVAMTMDEVRSAATRLAQQDAAKLKAILAEFGAGKLSEVPADNLGDFAGQVLSALN